MPRISVSTCRHPRQLDNQSIKDVLIFCNLRNRCKNNLFLRLRHGSCRGITPRDLQYHTVTPVQKAVGQGVHQVHQKAGALAVF